MKSSKNILQEKSYAFALKIIGLAKSLNESKEYILSKQILRSGTSVGALVEESIGAQGPKDFYHKITIAYKEARETKYWLRLLMDSNHINTKIGSDLLVDIEEIICLLGASRTTMKKNLQISY